MAKNQDYTIDVYFCCETEEENAMYRKFFDGISKK